jgi:methylmalonyl-CoA mutase C-terminal domain/subunit
VIAFQGKMSMTGNKIRVIVSKVGLDGHDRGARVVAALLRDAGMEVVYLGMYQTPEGVVQAAIDEDADVIGVSYLSGEHLVYTPKLVAQMKKGRLDDVLLLVGGSFPPEDIPVMKEMGVDEVFRGGSLTDSFVQYIRENVRRQS